VSRYVPDAVGAVQLTENVYCAFGATVPLTYTVLWLQNDVFVEETYCRL
jgi:hypothetical protein